MLDDFEDECALVLAGEGGAGVKNLVMRGEGEGAGAEVVRGGVEEGGGVEHVPDREPLFRGRGFLLRLFRGILFQR